jgi:uncharacterized damage-inducible protein DinB
MDAKALPLASVYAGWEDTNTSLVKAIAPLNPEQLAWRPAASLRSVGETVAHISSGRLGWFQRMDAPGSHQLAAQAAALGSEESIAAQASDLVRWLEATWQMVIATLQQWSVADLAFTYPIDYFGQTYAVSRQWILWRILAHDIHHGGQLAVMLGMLGVPIPELGDQGGHLSIPPLADPN